MIVNEYKVMFMRLVAIGYTEKTIDKTFGDVEYDDDDDEFSSVIKDLMIKEIKNNLLQVNLLNQSIIELLVEKEILTMEEVEERLEKQSEVVCRN